MIKRVLLAGILPLLLTACESAPNPYPNGPGFYESQIEDNRVRITYRTDGRTPRERAETIVLARAADLTLSKGYEWFQVVGRQAGVHQPNGPTIGLGLGNTSFGRHSAVGVGLGTSFNLAGPAAQVLTMEVVMGRGAKPNDLQAYDAADVSRTLRPQL